MEGGHSATEDKEQQECIYEHSRTRYEQIDACDFYVRLCFPLVDKLEPLRLLVIINPFSGKKNSVKLFRTIARPMFEVGGAIIVQELLTG